MGFLRRIILVFVPLVFLAVILEWKYADHRNYIDLLFEKAAAYDQEKYLLLGNSHMGVLGQAVFDAPSINLSIGGQDIFHQKVLAEYMIEHSNGIKTIIMNLDYSQIGYDLKLGGQLYMDRQYYPYSKEILGKGVSNKIMAASNFLRSNRDLAWLFQKKSSQAPEDLNFIPLESKELSQEQCRSRCQEHFQLKFNQSLQETNQDLILSLKEKCEEAGVRLILINPPKRPCYIKESLAHYDETQRQELRLWLANEGLEFIDIADEEFDDGLFRDSDHLNQQGVSKFIEVLSSYL